MSDNLYILVQPFQQSMIDGGDPVDHFRATLMFCGEPAGRGICPNIGEYKKDGTARGSAIALAQNDFIRNVLGKDIRDAPAPVVS